MPVPSVVHAKEIERIFDAAEKFEGGREGFSWKDGSLGKGYYLDGAEVPATFFFWMARMF